jgi:hypothetical protein
MKVIVNSEEFYELKFPEEIPINQIDFVIDRLTKLKKLFSDEMHLKRMKGIINKAVGINYNPDGSAHNVRTYNKWTTGRANAFIKMFEDKRIPKKEKFETMSNKFGVALDKIESRYYYLNERKA